MPSIHPSIHPSIKLILFTLSFVFPYLVGCTLNPNNDQDSTPAITAKVNEVTLSGQVAFPESSGTQASIKGRLEPQQFKIKIGNKTATIQSDGIFQISTTATFQFDLIVLKEGNPNPLLRKIATENEISDFIINSKSTSHAIAYDSYIEKSGNEKVDFESFKTFVPDNHVTVEEMTQKVEDALKSQQNVNSPDFKISEDPEVKKEKEKVLEEADKNDDQKVTICHIPPGNPGNRHTITISESALQAHLNHGDGVGVCPVEVFDGTAPTASSTPIITTSSTSTTTSSSTTTSTGAGTNTTTTSTSTTTGTTSTTKPSATFSISSGAAYTTSLSVTLNISGVIGTGIIEMSIDDGPFETFNGGKSYTLPAGEGIKTVKVVLRDSTGNISLDLTDTIILDSIPPAGTNTNIVATSTSSVSGKISWSTTEATFGRVEYGTSAGSLALSSTETGATTTHSISLTGLTASTTYFFKPTSADVAGNRIGTATFSFATPNTGQFWNVVNANAPFSARRNHTSVVFDDGTGLKMWVIGGEDGGRKNDVWKSSDGVTWTQATASAAFSARYIHSSVVFDDGTGLKMWVIGGVDSATYRNDVWKSSDGVTWTQATASAPFSARFAQSSVVFDDGTGLKMWVIGGENTAFRNDIWKSSDGVNWTQATAAAAFPVRSRHSSVTFDDGTGLKMWVIGGLDGGNRNDVWKSSDGVTWTQATGAAAFSARIWHSSVVFDDGTGLKMWVIGGEDGGSRNDIWKSSDGVTWTQATASASFSARYAHSSVPSNDGTGLKMWVIGGAVAVGDYRNDVWWSQ